MQASSFALAVVFFFLPVMKIEVLTNSVSDTCIVCVSKHRRSPEL